MADSALCKKLVLEKLKIGDVETQVVFWRRSRPAVRAICVHIIGEQEDAEDLADEIMTDFLFKYVHHLSHEEALESYLRLMTVRRAIRVRDARARARRPELVPNTEHREQPDESVAWAQLLPRLPSCLDKLTPKARQVIRLRFQSEMTNENIGSLVGGSKQYIGRVLKQSMTALRDCLERA